MTACGPAEYILPLKWTDDDGLAELTAYLRRVRDWIDVTVVDGSEPELFAVHAAAWEGLVRHVPVAVTAGANGKVRGVLTGIRLARHERIVLADDDVRYGLDELAAVVAALDGADLVVPQNHLVPAPWHARWNTARTLLNRGLGRDYPGTYGVRRSILERTGGYDADVLFENLEMERTIRAAGGVVRLRPDLYVGRRPPTARHFRSQRVRQAYDDFAQPGRLVAEACLLPLLVWASRRPAALLTVLVVSAAIAERGRRRHGGADVFPPDRLVWVPLWLGERAVTVWLAIAARCRGGVRYAGGRVHRAATPMRVLRRRHGWQARAAGSPGEPAQEVAATSSAIARRSRDHFSPSSRV